MHKFFSPSTGGFFDETIHGRKGRKGSRIPKDAVAVTDEEHAELLAQQSEGKSIVAGDGGRPVAVLLDRSVDEALASLRARRDRDLAATDWTQLGDAALSAAKRRLWAEHRKALRDLPSMVEAAVAAGQHPATIPYPSAPQS